MANWPSGSQLESYGIDPAWLDATFVNRGATWRVEGLHNAYRCTRPTPLAIVSTDGKMASIGARQLRKHFPKK